MNENGKLPNGWTTAELDSLAGIVLGQSPPSSEYNEIGEGLPFFQGKAEFGLLYPVKRVWCKSPNKIAHGGDVLLSVRAPVGPTNICPELSCIGRGLAAIRPLAGMETKFVLNLLRAHEANLKDESGGTTFEAITGERLRRIALPLPPLAEQHRIVAKIEELFTRLDAGVEALKQIKLQLKRYRQAVLNHAFEGKLTQEWREAQLKDPNSPLNTEPAAVLLERIKAERKKALGKKYKELSPVDTTDLPDLPEGWVWIASRSIFEWTNGDGLTREAMQPGDHLVYGGNGIGGNHNAWNNEHESIVIGRVGAHCGNVHIAMRKSWITDNAIYAKFVSPCIDLRFCLYLLRNEKLNSLSGGSGQPYVSQAILNPLALRLPSSAEQREIADKIEMLLSIADAVENTIDNTIAESDRLRQAILKRAFEGKLVPQDPNDEPAEKLLERIRADREGEQERKKNGKAVVKKSVKKSRVKAKK